MQLGLEKPESVTKQHRHCGLSWHRHEVQFSDEFTELCLDFDAQATKQTFLIFAHVFDPKYLDSAICSSGYD